MAKYVPKDRDPSTIRTEIESAVIADSFNLDTAFLEKNRARFEDIKDSVNSIIRSYGYIDKRNADINNPLADYNLMLYNTIDRQSYQKELMIQNVSQLASGARSITQENTSNGIESEIISSFQKLTEDTFSLMNEYRIGVSLIPELKRVMKLIVRDILNPNEITKRSIKNVYAVDKESVDFNEEEVNAINEKIDVEITEKYRIEKNLPIWLYEMLVSGAKPILVMPYKDILKQALVLANIKNNNFSSEGMNETTDHMSVEQFESYLMSDKDFDVNKIYDSLKRDIFKDKSPKKRFSQSYEDDKPEDNPGFNIDGIIDDSLVDELYNEGIERLYETLNLETARANKEKTTQDAFGIESSSDNIYETVNAIKETIEKIEGVTPEEEDEKKKQEKLEEQKKIKEKIKNQMKMFVGQVSDNIDIVKDDFSKLSLGKDRLFKSLNQNEKTKHLVDGMYIKNNDELDEITGKLGKDVLLIELDPEHVIPVTIGSEHISYYIYEADTYAGPMPSNSRRQATFSQIVASTGYGNDKAVINASNGVSVMPNDPSLSSVFNPADFGNLNIPVGGSDIMEGSRRVEIMKQILFKTLAHKMDDKSLIDNKCFQDAIMSLIRQGYIINRKVQFTHIPASNLVYFAHDIDDKGLPHSVLDGTLLQIYMYLAGIVSATLDIVRKSSDKEKLEVNMGISNQINMTLMEIQRNLATRNIHVRSFFDNIGSVLRNTATYLRLVIPVVDGEKLYDVSNVESPSGSPIDTEFINQRLESILSAIPCPPAITNMIKEAEFSRGILNQNIEYRNSVIERQQPVCTALTKLYRLIGLYQGTAVTKSQMLKNVNENEKKSEEVQNTQINVMNMEVTLTPPMYLNMTTIQEIFSNVEPVVDSYIKYYYGDSVDDPVQKIKVQKARKELIKTLATQIDFNTIENLLDGFEKTTEIDSIDLAKNTIVSESTKNSLGGDSGGF